jgi:sulfur-oxidizing protein SoxX
VWTKAKFGARPRSLGVLAAGFAAALSANAAAQPLVKFEVRGDEIRQSLSGQPGDAARGRDVALNRTIGACLLCHAAPGSTERFAGNIAPTLAGVGARLSPAQLRLRVVDSTRVNPDTPMPAYYRTEGLNQVAAAYRDKPVLTAQQVEDVVAWLATLKEPPK